MRRNELLECSVLLRLSKEDTNQPLKNISEGEIVVNTDDYSIYGDLNKLENVKNHKIVNHPKAYTKDGIHVNTAENRNGFLKSRLGSSEVSQNVIWISTYHSLS